jgi:hypothetical protein
VSLLVLIALVGLDTLRRRGQKPRGSGPWRSGAMGLPHLRSAMKQKR